MDRDESSVWLAALAAPALATPALALSYLVWAALHDISRESDVTFEYTALAICIPLLLLVHAAAVRTLPPGICRVWLWSAACLLLLFDTGAAASWVHPKYLRDREVGMAFLAASVPALMWIAWRLRKTAARA